MRNPELGSVFLGVAVIIASSFCLSAETVASLQTPQTFVQLSAQRAAPQLISLANPGSSHPRVKQWRNSAPEKLIDHVTIEGQSVAVTWKFNTSESQVDAHHVVFVYDCANPHLRLRWEWIARDPTGPLEHTIHIESLDTREMWLPMQNSFQFEMRTTPTEQLEQLYIEKGASSPSVIGTHQDILPVGGSWTGTSSTYAHPAKGEPREVIPFFAVAHASKADNLDHDGWYAGIEFSGRTRLTIQRDSNRLRGSVGLNPEPGPFSTCLEPHGTFATPTVFVGAFAGGFDGLGNTLRPWVRRALGNPRTWANPQFPMLVNNSWGSGMQVDEALAQRMVRDSAELGLEMFHLDAGWFRAVGDWHPDTHKFPRGLKAIADDAHDRGLKFGIWSDWTQAALSTAPGALNVRDPRVADWATTAIPSDWQPEEFKGVTIDIGVPAAQAHAKAEVLRMVEDYSLDMLEHDGYLVAQGCSKSDHPHASPNPAHLSITRDEGYYFVESSNSTDVSYHAVRAYYDIYAELRRSHPAVLLEICNDGGRMVDFGSAAHGDYFSITDSYTPLSNRQAFYDASHLLPAAMLETYVEKWPTPTIESFRYMLRSGMMGWLTIMQDTNAWTAEQHAEAKREFQLYKQELRALIRDADLYHIGARPNGIHWDGTEFFDPRRRRGVVYAFRGSGTGDEETWHRFRLFGLNAAKGYRIRFHDGSASTQLIAGRDLLTAGLMVKLTQPNSSELIFVEEAELNAAARKP